MRFGSVCSGIEAASVAWEPLGWKAAWLAEIEPFPSAVLKYHYADTPNLGDMTTLPDRILSGEVEAPDLFCGGTPCQAFSVAGLRKSLDDARGNLSLTFCEIADAIDTIRYADDRPAAIVFWENVPGVLSTKDNAFGCFLAGLAGESDALIPAGGKWTDAGVVYGPTRTVAWRTLDAQYFGLAQRRKRVFVVASAREDIDPVEILFEREGMRRDTAPSREAGEGITGTLEASLGKSRGAGTPVSGVVPQVAGALDTECGGGKLTHQSIKNGHVIGTITARMFNALGARDVEEGALLAVDTYNQSVDQVSPTLATKGDHGYGNAAVLWPQECAPTLPADYGAKQGLDDQHIKNGGGLFVPSYGIPDNWIGRAPENGGNATEPMHDVAPCLTKADRHGVAHPIAWDEELNASVDIAGTILRGGDGGRHDGVAQPIPFGVGESPDLGHCLRSGASKADKHESTTYVAQPLAFPLDTQNMTEGHASGGKGFGEANDPSFTLTKGHSHAVATVQQPITFGAQMSMPQVDTDMVQTLQAKNPMAVAFQANSRDEVRLANGDGSITGCLTDEGRVRRGGTTQIATSMAVRRLTPVECERLQGFPDGYTAIPWRGKPAEECPDGPRYKALGNSWAVPVVRWIGQRIQDAVDKGAKT